MGYGAFGGMNIATTAVMMNRTRGGYGGSNSNDNNEDPENSKFKWSRFIVNTLLFLPVLFFFVCMFGTPNMYYSRLGTLVNKYKSEHKHKSKSYTHYNFTVEWSDRKREEETIEVDFDTYINHKNYDKVYFKRLKEKYEWTNGFWMAIGFVGCGLIWGFYVGETLSVRRYE